MGINIMIISGEASGDLHGASLIKALKTLIPEVSIMGMGGEKMIREGLIGIDSTALSVVGVSEVAGKLKEIFKAFSLLKKMLSSQPFDCVVLIDYPDFNLRFANAAKKKGIPVVYYISPQIWAWRKNRIHKIKKTVAKMLVVLPFEEEIYKKAGVDVEYVGHPLVETAVLNMTKDAARCRLGIEKSSIVIALLPGSRIEEIKKLLPLMCEGIEIIKKTIKSAEALLALAVTIDESLVREYVKGYSVPIKIVKGNTYELLRASDAAVVASGTATLETALIGCPMVIVYKMSAISYILAKMLVGIEHAGLPNIIAGKKIVGELIQDKATPENISAELLSIITNSWKKEEILKGYELVKKMLKGNSAPQRAARAIYKVIESRQ